MRLGKQYLLRFSLESSVFERRRDGIFTRCERNLKTMPLSTAVPKPKASIDATT